MVASAAELLIFERFDRRPIVTLTGFLKTACRSKAYDSIDGGQSWIPIHTWFARKWSSDGIAGGSEPSGGGNRAPGAAGRGSRRNFET
jgi:hypothetical protein